MPLNRIVLNSFCHQWVFTQRLFIITDDWRSNHAYCALPILLYWSPVLRLCVLSRVFYWGKVYSRIALGVVYEHFGLGKIGRFMKLGGTLIVFVIARGYNISICQNWFANCPKLCILGAYKEMAKLDSASRILHFINRLYGISLSLIQKRQMIIWVIKFWFHRASSSKLCLSSLSQLHFIHFYFSWKLCCFHYRWSF